MAAEEVPVTYSPWYALDRNDPRMLGYDYCTPDYVMGSLIIDPAFDSVHLVIIFPLAAALIVTLVLVVTKVLTRTVSPVSITVWGSILLLIYSGLLVPFYWVEVAPSDILPLVMTGVFGGLATLFITISVRYADLKTIAPFQYTSLVWSTILGVVIFNHYPGYMTWLGVAVIIIAGLFLLKLDHGKALRSQLATSPAKGNRGI